MTSLDTRTGHLTDEDCDDVIAAVLELAVRVRDEVGPGVAAAARDALAAAGGDPVAALTVAAALIRPDLPVESWWQRPAPRINAAPCGTVSAARRHRVHREPLDRACQIAERAYWRERKAARREAQSA